MTTASSPVAFGSGVLTEGSNSSGANKSCQCCLKALPASKRQPRDRRVLQPPEGVHLRKGTPC